MRLRFCCCTKRLEVTLVIRMLFRRQILGLPLLFAASRAWAFREQARFQFAQIRHGGRWDPRPDGLPRLAWEISKRTSIETSPMVKAMALADPELFRYPMAVQIGRASCRERV